MKGYVYKIQNIRNGKMYIGSTINFVDRKKHHLWQLRNNKHHSLHLQRAWNKYGENSFLIDIIKEVDIENIINEEQDLIDAKGYYNISIKAAKPPINSTSISIYDKNIKHIGDFDSIRDANRKLSKKMQGHGKYPYYSKGYYIFLINTKIDEISKHIKTRYDKWHKKKSIYQYSKDGKFIKKWSDLRCASKYYSGKKLNTNILSAIKRQGTAYGFKWSFTEIIPAQIDKRLYGKTVNIFLDGKFIKKCKSINQAAKYTKKHKQTVSRNYKNKTKTVDGYEFK